ncbi:MAG: hypothetical protein LBC59_07340 [Chitinispirillales bacterium]|jgi:hypothetical protein|nr:hypothetical protein [Chitinispirillales bacterium]
MSIRRLAVAVAVGAFMVGGGVVFAQGPVTAEEALEEAAEETVEEEVTPPAPVAPPVVAAVEAPAPAPAPEPAAEAKPAAKPEPKVDLYGSASYRFRGRLWNATDKDDKSGSSFDYLNLLGWSFGAKVKVDDQISLQFQIGNDLNSGESITWWNNKAPQGRSYLAGADNLYVHLAYGTWNPGPLYLTGGVIPVVSNGTLDLLERSMSTGKYDESIFQTWSSQLINSLIALKLGVPIVKDGVKVNAELTYSIIDPRVQSLVKSGDAGLSTPDADPKSNSTGSLFILDIPVVAGDFKVTPEFTYISNRNYNETLEKGDDELIYGFSASYKVNAMISLNANFAAGSVSNENSLVGTYGNSRRSDTNTVIADANKYVSNGLLYGIGGTVKAGPGTMAIGISAGNSYNGADKYSVTTTDNSDPENPVVTVKNYDPKTLTNRDDYIVDVRYTWNIHSKFNIAPRWRFYYSAYDENSGKLKSKIENRPELVMTWSF